MIRSDFENQLKESLHYGFINQSTVEVGNYSPKIVINNPENNQFVLSDIHQELIQSTGFYFSVAFVTQSGIALIKSQLADLKAKNV